MKYYVTRKALFLDAKTPGYAYRIFAEILEFESEDIIRAIEISNERIAKALYPLEKVACNPTCNPLAVRIVRNSTKKYLNYETHVIDAGAAVKFLIRDSIGMLSGMRIANNRVLGTIRKGKSIESKLYMVTPAAEEIIVASLVNSTKCERCNKLIETQDLDIHQKHYLCKQEAARRVLAGNMMKVHGIEAELAILAAGIQHTEIVERYGIYVPDWVHKAIDLYNKGEEKYANMSLTEFLNAMKPT